MDEDVAGEGGVVKDDDCLTHVVFVVWRVPVRDCQLRWVRAEVGAIELEHVHPSDSGGPHGSG